jgi:hypothetical protein
MQEASLVRLGNQNIQAPDGHPTASLWVVLPLYLMIGVSPEKPIQSDGSIVE